MSRVGEIRWHFGTYQICVAVDGACITWAIVDPSWLDWHCIPSEWVKRGAR